MSMKKKKNEVDSMYPTGMESKEFIPEGLEKSHPSESSEEEETAPSEDKAEEIMSELEDTANQLKQQLQEMEDRWKRAVADLDNYRKRFERELARLRFAERDLVLREWLPILDNMERALQAEKAEENPWYKGVQAIHRQMLDTLKCFGVESFYPKGEVFNPEFHDAIATINVENEPEGKIAEVVETGYKINGRVLRPARVIPVRHQ